MAFAGPPDTGLSAPPGKLKHYVFYTYFGMSVLCFYVVCCHGSTIVYQHWIDSLCLLASIKPFVQQQENKCNLLTLQSLGSNYNIFSNLSDLCMWDLLSLVDL